MTSNAFQCKEIIWIGRNRHSHTHAQNPAGCYDCSSVPAVIEMKACPQEGGFSPLSINANVTPCTITLLLSSTTGRTYEELMAQKRARLEEQLLKLSLAVTTKSTWGRGFGGGG